MNYFPITIEIVETRERRLINDPKNLPLRKSFKVLETNVKLINEKEVAARYDSGKSKMYYILHYCKALETLVRILEYGAYKYSDFNWKKGGKPDSEYLSACLRHMFKYINGEDIDPETGCHHIGHAIWNLMTLLELNITQNVDEELFKEIVNKFQSKEK